MEKLLVKKIDSKEDYHIPVLLPEVIEALNILPEGVYVDATFGGGGHAKAILNRMTAKGRLFGFDQDEDAESNIITDKRFTFTRANFTYISHFLEYYNVKGVDGILADLGVSSFQFDKASRGFSYRFSAKLDMRMNQSLKRTAATILDTYDTDELKRVFSDYGEIRNAITLSEAIIDIRKGIETWTMEALNSILQRVYRGDRSRYYAQVYQALRIEVNNEIGSLKEFLVEARDLLKPGGRVAIISFHSLEDRVVKQFFKTGNWEGRRETDEFGNAVHKLKLLNSKPIEAGRDEVFRNRRATSAKLRVAEKI